MKRKIISLFVESILILTMIAGCGLKNQEQQAKENLADNVVITETGEVIEKQEELPEKQETQEMPEQESSMVDVEKLDEPQPEQIVTEEDQTEPQGNSLQLVFLGDSIFDTYRDGTGVPYRTAVQCEADVYNLAIGGTCAALEYDESAETEEWTSTSLIGVVRAIAGEIPTDIFEGKAAKKLLDNPNIDFTQTDYFIVEYGMNDFLRATPLKDENDELFNLKTYVGALRYAVSSLQSIAPDATIILCAPNYAEFYYEGRLVGNGNSTNNGYGTLFDYKGICEYVSKEYQTLFFNAFQDLGIDAYTADEYLEDGIHLSDSGRQLYADALAKMILSHEETKNN